MMMHQAKGHTAWTRLWSRLTRKGLEREVEEELTFHLEMLELEHKRLGLSPKEARERAEMRFGNVKNHRHRATKTRNAQMRRRRRMASMDSLSQDLKYAVRNLRKTPGFTAVVLLTLTIGIGSTVAMYSVMDAAMGRALPFPEPNQLVIARATFGGNVNPFASFLDYLDYKEQGSSFEHLGAFTGFNIYATVTGTEEPEQVPMLFATRSLFSALGVSPILGRTFSEEDVIPGSGGQVLVISYGYWQRRLGGDPNIIGQTLSVNGTPFTIVGVMPADFYLMFEAEAWIPAVEGGPMTTARRFHNWLMVGRLQNGVTIEEAQAEVDVISAQLEEAYPASNQNKALQIDSLHEGLVEGYSQGLYILLGAIVLVLLIACGNVASLLMARGSARATEMAVRSALGAGRGRLVRQLFSESLVMALIAGTLGVLMATWLQDLILGFTSLDRLGIHDLDISGRILPFALILSLGTALLFGMFPSFATVRANPVEELKEGSRGSTKGKGARVRNSLVVLQVAISLVLLIGSGLLIRSYSRLMGVDPGFQVENLLTAGISLPGTRYPDVDDRVQFFTSLQESIEALPGVEAAALASMLPIKNPGNNVGAWNPETPPSADSRPPTLFQRVVLPGYFDLMGIPLMMGRDISEEDTESSPNVIILTQLAADTLFPGEVAVGRSVAVDRGGDQPVLFEVVGIVANHRITSLSSRYRGAMFFSYRQRPQSTMGLAVRARGEAETLVRPIQDRLWAKDRDIPLADVETMESIISSSVSTSRSIATVLGMFSGVAMFLAALGLYGVLAYFVSRKVHEIGIRVALGATAGGVVQLVLKRGMLLVGGGLVLGLAGAFGASRFLESFMFQMGTTDAGTFAGVSIMFILVSLMACLIPAWKALRINPVDAFRAE